MDTADMRRPLLLAVLLLVAGCQAPTPAALPPPVTPPGAPSACHSVDGKADRHPWCTPGVTNPQVIQGGPHDNIATTICRPGWTDTIRPPAAYTNRLKAQQMRIYGLTGAPADYEEDHLIPLALGGDPNDPHNLYPQPWNGAGGAYTKDGRERALHAAVCAGRMWLVDAQKAIVTEWSWCATGCADPTTPASMSGARVAAHLFDLARRP